MTVTIFCVGAWYVNNTIGITIDRLVAFNMFTARLSQPVLRITGLWRESSKPPLQSKDSAT